MKTIALTTLSASGLRARLADYAALVKLRLSLLVVFSSLIGYLLGANTFNYYVAFMVVIGGLLITFAANSMNQVLEKDFDKLMKRTQFRPLVTGRLTVSAAVLFSGLSCLVGTSMLAAINIWAAFFGMLSFLLYAFVYTPLKRIHPIAVLVGAIPGAMPVFIGWISGSGTLGQEGLLLFSLQFFWQFPHFWAIAWLGHEDYQRAGFRLLPERDGIPTQRTAKQSLLYAACLIFLPVAHFIFGFTGWLGLTLLLIAGFHYTFKAFQFYRILNDQTARGLLFASFFYLPVALLTLYLDKILGL